MIIKSKITAFILFSMLALLIIEVIYINKTKTISSLALKHKFDFVKMTSMPDLAISTEANYIRHRSMSNIHSIYRDDGTLREYFPSTYVINHSNIKENR